MSKNLQRNLLPRNFRFLGDEVLEDLFISKEPPPAGSVFQYVHVPLEHHFMPRHAEAAWKKFIKGLDESKPWLIPSFADVPGNDALVDLPNVKALPPAARVYAAYKQNSSLVFQFLPTDSIGQPWAELATWEAKHGEIGFLTVGWNGYADRYGNLSAESTITSCHLHNLKDERLTYTDYRKHKIVKTTELVERTEPRELPVWQAVSVSSELYEQSLLWHEEDVRERLAQEARDAERAARIAKMEVPPITTKYDEAQAAPINAIATALATALMVATSGVAKEDQKIHQVDCGSTETLAWTVLPERDGVPSDLKNLAGKYYYLEGETELRRVSAEDTHLIGKKIFLRGIYCKHADSNSLCFVCAGLPPKHPIDFQPTKTEAMAIATMQETLAPELAEKPKVDMPELSIEDHLVEIESRWINEINSIYDRFDASGFDMRAYVKKVHAAMRDRPDFAAIVEEAIK